MQHLLQEGKIKKEKPEIKMSKENNYRSIFHKLAFNMSEKKLLAKITTEIDV